MEGDPFAPPLSTAQRIPAQVTDFEIHDLEYRVVDGQPLLGRLYRPASGRTDVVVVEVHGGAWIMNDRLTNAVIHKHLAAQGVAVFALDFRLAPAHPFPAAIEDVNFAIRWVKANLKPKVIGGLGTSSGGYQIVLSALLAGEDTRLDFVIACWPILDPLARYRMAKAKGLKNLVDAHHAFFKDEAAMTEANPQLILERGEATSLPPMLVLQGTADENVEHRRADAFAQCYRRAGGEIELHKFEGQPHTFVVKDPTSAASLEALAKISQYIQSRLQKDRAYV
jgi:acetyl esterase